MYLLSTTIANRTKAKYYEEDLPSFENVSLISKTMIFRWRINLGTSYVCTSKGWHTNNDPDYSSLEAFQRRILERFVKILMHSQKLESSHLDSLKSHVVATEGRLNEVNVHKDEDIFIQYNVRTFTAPTDWKFEPCQIHHDTVRCRTSMGFSQYILTIYIYSQLRMLWALNLHPKFSCRTNLDDAERNCMNLLLS